MLKLMSGPGSRTMVARALREEVWRVRAQWYRASDEEDRRILGMDSEGYKRGCICEFC